MAAGIADVVVPALFPGALGIQIDPSGTALARLYGAELLGFNVATLLARQGLLVRPVVLGHVVNESLTAIIFVGAAINGLGNVRIWPLAALAACFAIGYAFVGFRPPDAAPELRPAEARARGGGHASPPFRGPRLRGPEAGVPYGRRVRTAASDGCQQPSPAKGESNHG